MKEFLEKKERPLVIRELAEELDAPKNTISAAVRRYRKEEQAVSKLDLGGATGYVIGDPAEWTVEDAPEDDTDPHVATYQDPEAFQSPEETEPPERALTVREDWGPRTGPAVITDEELPPEEPETFLDELRALVAFARVNGFDPGDKVVAFGRLLANERKEDAYDYRSDGKEA